METITSSAVILNNTLNQIVHWPDFHLFLSFKRVCISECMLLEWQGYPEAFKMDRSWLKSDTHNVFNKNLGTEF